MFFFFINKIIIPLYILLSHDFPYTFVQKLRKFRELMIKSGIKVYINIIFIL